MKRYHIVNGDKTTAGGVVIGTGIVIDMGQKTALIGDKIDCLECGEVGNIVADGPRISFKINGSEAALEGDLCLCKCNPSPRLIGVPIHICQNIDDSVVIAKGFGSWIGINSNAYGSIKSEEHIVDQFYELIDEHGEPIESYRYDLLYDGTIIKKSGDFSSGKTNSHSENVLTEIVVWLNKSGEIKS